MSRLVHTHECKHGSEINYQSIKKCLYHHQRYCYDADHDIYNKIFITFTRPNSEYDDWICLVVET